MRILCVGRGMKKFDDEGHALMQRGLTEVVF